MDKTIEISSVHDAEIRPPKRGDTSGCIITFISNENVVKNDKVLITKDNSNHYFDVVGIKITEDNKLRVEAKEVGYWSRKFERQNDFDLRTIIGLSVHIVKDAELLQKIYEESCWC